MTTIDAGPDAAPVRDEGTPVPVVGLTETQAAVRDVVVEALERDADWAALAAAGVLGLVVPERLGGEGLGLAEAAVVVREVGRRTRDLPVLETLAAGALLVARAGTPAQQDRLLAGVAEGRTLLVPALREPGTPLVAVPGTLPRTVLTDGRVTGRKVGVTGAVLEGGRLGDLPTHLLVTAVRDGRPVVALVDAAGPGVSLVPVRSSGGRAAHALVLDGAPAQVLGEEAATDAAAAERAARLVGELAAAALASSVAGVVAGARDLTAAHTKQRRQFGRALAEFQAVSLQVSDVYVASRTLDLVADNAVWRVEHGLPAADDLAVAAYWVASEAPQAVQTCHHLHGGTGVDITYPLHRHFGWATDAAHAFGGAHGALEPVAVEDPVAKNLELTPEQRALKAELRAYFTGLATHDEHLDMMKDRHGPTFKAMVRHMGADGWMGVGWPREHGGHGFGEVEQTVFANEAQRADVHLPAVTLMTVGPTLMSFGTEKQKEMFLGPILAGEVHFAIGYSEPDAGTDLASLRTSARRDGDHYVVNGQKLWTTGGHAADYVWLAVRTDPDAPKHKGISILIVDTRDPGFSSTPIITADGSHHVNATFYQDVRVPVDMLVGEENQGWKLLTTQLNHERVMLGPAGRIEGLRDRVVAWAGEHGVLDRPDVRAVLGETTATFRVNELLNWEVARAAADGEVSVADASASKVFASERVQVLGRRLTELVARHGDPSDPSTEELLAYLDAQAKRNLVLTFGGGVNEVQRELVSMFGLGMPRVPR